MLGRIPINLLMLALVLSLVLFFTEYFIPLSANFQFRAECRKTLLEMEEKNELTAAMRTQLQNALTEKDFTVISISSPHTAKRGEYLNLKVIADYKYNRVTGLFKREEVTERMEYDKYTVARRVLN